MRHSLLLPAVMLGSALVVACGEQPTYTEPGGVGVNLALMENTRNPFTTVYGNPCNGEDIAFEGFLHMLATETPDGSGGFHVVSHYNLNLRGVGQTTGATYTGVEGFTDAFNVKPPYPVNETFTIHTNVVGRGQAPDFRAHTTFHKTINANGQLTVFFQKFRAKCSSVVTPPDTT